jgi:hypothetical protein
MEIKSVGSDLFFHCEGPIGVYEVQRSESNGSMSFVLQQDTLKIIQGVFSLKNLMFVNKCTQLAQQVELYLENDLPLVVKYDVSGLGQFKLCFAEVPTTTP